MLRLLNFVQQDYEYYYSLAFELLQSNPDVFNDHNKS